MKIKAFLHCSVINEIRHTLKNRRKINNLYPILPTNGFLIALEKREKSVKVLMLNYASKPLNAVAALEMGNTKS